MQDVRCTLAILVLVAMVAQTPAINAQSATYRQVPDAAGVYFVGPEVSQPTLSSPALAVYGDEMAKSKVSGISIWSVVIGADGIPVKASLLQRLGGAFDQAAIDAIRQSKFEPGKLSGKPVAVRVGVMVPFRYGKYPSAPFIAIIERDVDPIANGWNEVNSVPVAIHTVAGNASNDAIKAKYKGVSLVRARVGTNGIPEQVGVIRPVGMGLDEKALDAVRQYRFKPAMRDGTAIPAQINIEVRFMLY